MFYDFKTYSTKNMSSQITHFQLFLEYDKMILDIISMNNMQIFFENVKSNAVRFTLSDIKSNHILFYSLQISK